MEALVLTLRVVGSEAEPDGPRARRLEQLTADLRKVGNYMLAEWLRKTGDEFVRDLPNDGVRMRRPTGGYRSTLLGGTVVQEAGERTGALPGRVISSLS